LKKNFTSACFSGSPVRDEVAVEVVAAECVAPINTGRRIDLVGV
jgi:hypothetical protein